MMNENIVLTLIEMLVSLIVEGIILTMIFNWISNKSGEKQQQNLKNEMNNMEKQNKFEYEHLQFQIENAKHEIISQIKESAKKG